MMKWKWIVLALLSSFAIVLEGAEKIALTAYGENAGRLSDLFFAQFSNHYEFVERSQIAELEHEQFLQQKFGAEKRSRQAQVTGASIFLIFQDLAEDRTQVSVFETEYGFRLKTFLLADDAPVSLQKKLDSVLEKIQAPEKMRLISLAAIRNNLHHSLHASAERVMEELTKHAHELDVVFLERDYLIELLRERDLSGKWANAVFASEILHFELNPGRGAEDFRIAAYLTDAEDKVTFRKEVKGDHSIVPVFDALTEYFSHSSQKKNYQAENEAARFAREAEIAEKRGNLESATRLFFAAFALNNSNIRYLNQIGNNSDGQKFPAVYPYYRAALEYLVAHEKLLWDNNTHTAAMLLCHIIKDRKAELPPETRQSYWTFLSRHRDQFLDAVLFEEIPPFAPDRELNRFPKIIPDLYPSSTEYRIALQTAWRSLLASLQNGKPSAMPEEHWQWLLQNGVYGLTETLFKLQNALPRKELPVWTREASSELNRLGFPELRPLSLLLETNALFYSREYSDDQVLTSFQNYFQLAEELKAGLPDHCVFYDHQKLAQYPGMLEKVGQLRRKPSVASTSHPAERKLWPPGEEPSEILASFFEPITEALFFLTCDEFDYKVMKLDHSNTVREIATFPRGYQDSGVNQNRGWQLHANGNHLVAANSDRVYAGTDGILTELRQFPFQISSVAFCKNRIFLGGEKELMSCDIRGEERQILFSASQTEKTLDIQKKHPELKIQTISVDAAGENLRIELKSTKRHAVLLLKTESGEIIEDASVVMSHPQNGSYSRSDGVIKVEPKQITFSETVPSKNF